MSDSTVNIVVEPAVEPVAEAEPVVEPVRIVLAKVTAFVGFDGREIRVERGSERYSDDPLVAAFPDLFAAPLLERVVVDDPVDRDNTVAPAVETPPAAPPARRRRSVTR